MYRALRMLRLDTARVVSVGLYPALRRIRSFSKKLDDATETWIWWRLSDYPSGMSTYLCRGLCNQPVSGAVDKHPIPLH